VPKRRAYNGGLVADEQRAYEHDPFDAGLMNPPPCREIGVVEFHDRWGEAGVDEDLLLDSVPRWVRFTSW
jgi:hypothetical protein